MKKIKILITLGCLFLVGLVSFNSFALSVWCIHGRAYFVYTDANGGRDVWQNGTCFPDGRMYIILNPPSEIGFNSVQLEASPKIYEMLNGLGQPILNYPEEIVNNVEGEAIKTYRVDPFKLDLSVAEILAKSDNLSLYGLKVLGNPVVDGQVHCLLLSDKDQTVTAKVMGNFGAVIYENTIVLKRGQNDISIDLGVSLPSLSHLIFSCDKNVINKTILSR